MTVNEISVTPEIALL